MNRDAGISYAEPAYPESPGAGGRRAAFAAVTGLGLVFALMLALPARTVTTVYVNDLMIFLDGAHRVAWGQTPNLDFHTALGPLNYYLPALGAWISGSLGGALPVGVGLLAALLAPVFAHLLASRLPPLLAVAYGAFLLLVVAAPVNLGESVHSLSFAMFYNRIGWACLGALLVMHMRPREDGPVQEGADAACAALLTVLMLFLKVTYGAVAVAFLILLLLDPRQRRRAALALSLTLLASLAILLLWRGGPAHLADLLLAGRVSGARSLADLGAGFLRHLPDYLLFAVLAGLALRARGRRVRDALFFAFCAGPGLLVMNQNSQPWGILTLHAGAVVAAALILRGRREEPRAPVLAGSLAGGAPLLVLAILLPTILQGFTALSLHAALASARSGEETGLPNLKGVAFAELWTPLDAEFSRRYLASLKDGAEVLASLEPPARRVTALDFASPFSAGMGLEPPRGDSSWLHWNRNVDAEHHVPPESLLRGAEVVMLPKWGVNPGPLREVYGPHVAERFEPAAESQDWTVLVRRSNRVAGP